MQEAAKKINSMKLKPKSQQTKLVNQTKTKTKIHTQSKP